MSEAAARAGETAAPEGFAADSMLKSAHMDPAQAPGAGEAVQKAKILVVDDEPKSLYALQELLSPQKLLVLCAASELTVSELTQILDAIEAECDRLLLSFAKPDHIPAAMVLLQQRGTQPMLLHHIHLVTFVAEFCPAPFLDRAQQAAPVTQTLERAAAFHPPER